MVMGRVGSVGSVWWPLAAFWRADDVVGGHECVCFSMRDDDDGDVSQSFHFAFRGQRALFFVSSGFTMKLAELVRLSEDDGCDWLLTRKSILRKRGMWYGGWEV